MARYIAVGAGKGAHGIVGILAHETGDAAFPAVASGLQFPAITIGDMSSVYANLVAAADAVIVEWLVRWAATGIGHAINAKGITGEEGRANVCGQMTGMYGMIFRSTSQPNNGPLPYLLSAERVSERSPSWCRHATPVSRRRDLGR